jgi:hypothetical protein
MGKNPDFAFRLTCGPLRMGAPGFYDARGGWPSGRCCRVDFDSAARFYRVERGEVRAFKRWVRDVFPPNNGERYRVTGSFPHYTVEIAR